MLHRPMMRALSLGAACLALASVPETAPADVYLETSYVPTGLLSTDSIIPTAYATAYYPTSYVSTSAVLAPESMVYPTSTTVVRRSVLRPRRYVERTYYSYPSATAAYLSPTSYITSSSLLPTTYVTRASLLPTTYVTSSSLLPTAYVTRSSLLPTTYVTDSYVVPTSYVIDNGLVTTSLGSSSYPCDTPSSPPARSTASRPSNAGGNSGESGNSIVSTPSGGASTGDRRPQATINNNADDASYSTGKPNEVPAPVKTPQDKADTPPEAPLPQPDPAKDVKVPEAGKAGATNPQAVEPTTFRSARRPNYDGRNILRGRVISAETRRPEEGVAITVSNVTKTFIDRPAMTDAFGEFNVSLPDGDWVVKVKMPGGSVYQVGRDYVTASNGRVIDAAGRNVAEFVITR